MYLYHANFHPLNILSLVQNFFFCQHSKRRFTWLLSNLLLTKNNDTTTKTLIMFEGKKKKADYWQTYFCITMFFNKAFLDGEHVVSVQFERFTKKLHSHLHPLNKLQPFMPRKIKL